MSKHRYYPLFSDEDADLRLLKWRADAKGYARRTARSVVGDRSILTGTTHAHRIVLERKVGRPLLPSEFCDHKNRIRLDCRRENLELSNPSRNSQNRSPMSKCGIRGVTFHRQTGKWQAQVKTGSKSHYCGLFRTPEEAGEAAKAKRMELGFAGEGNA